MKTKKITCKLTGILVLALMIWGGAVNAQSEEQIKKFNQERESYFNEKLELTASEKQAFWPVYEDFTHRKMKVLEEERNTFKYSNENADNLSDEEINEILDRILDYKRQVFKLEQEYYKDKFPKVLPPEKVLKLYRVEWDFRRHLVRKLRGDGHGKGGGRGPGGSGSGPGAPEAGGPGGPGGPGAAGPVGTGPGQAAQLPVAGE